MRWNDVERSLVQKLREAEPVRYGDVASYTGGGSLGQAFGAVNAMINDPDDLRSMNPDISADNSTTAGGAPGTADDNSEPATTGSVGSAGVSASDDLITMLKGFEGYHQKVNPEQGDRSNVRPYWDVAQWSIGYGSYAGSRNRNQRPNLTWTPAQAEQALRSQLRRYRANVEHINRRGRYQWTPGQLDALTSFAYNLGSINELTQNGRRSNREIADKMMEYVNAGGQRLPGLVNRRRIERQKFLAGMTQGRLDYRPGGAS